MMFSLGPGVTGSSILTIGGIMKLIYAIVLVLSTFGCGTSVKENKAATLPQAAKPSLPATKVTMSEEYRRSLLNTTLECKRSTEIRQIEFLALAPKGCELWYSRYGGKNKVAWSSNGDDHCKKTQKQIRSNLEVAGFKCEAPQRESGSEKVENKK